MTRSDTERLFESLLNSYIAKGRPVEQVTAQLCGVWIKLLPDLTISQVEDAIDTWSRDGSQKFPPTPGDVLAIARNKAQGRAPQADEAWATALRAADEGETIVWTDQISEAWTIARPILDAGDEVGARMAFRAAYTRLMDSARESGTRIRAWVSLGHDPDRREPAVKQAVSAGLLTKGQAAKYLSAPMTGEGQALVAGLLGSNIVAHPASSETRDKIAALRAAIKRQDPPEQTISLDELERRKAAARAIAADAIKRSGS